MRCLLFILLAFTFATSATATPAPYLLAFKAYQETKTAGDMVAAEAHAERAWRLAEEDEDASPNEIALLVQNYLLHAIKTNPTGALPVAERALELHEQGFGTDNFTAPELKLARAYAISQRKPGRKSSYDGVLDIIAGFGPNELPATLFSVDLALMAAGAAGSAQHYKAMSASADHIIVAMKDAPIRPNHTLVTGYLLKSVAHFMGTKTPTSLEDRNTKKRLEHIYDVHILLHHAKNQFDPQESIRSFDPLLAQTMAWQSLMRAFLLSYDAEMPENHRFMGLEHPDTEGPILRSQCPRYTPKKWLKQKEPRYPKNSLYKDQPGAAIIGFDLSPDGSVVDPIILAEVPAAAFGKNIVEAIKHWKADISSTPPACMTNLLMTFTFAIDPNS
ncbi:MAG: hypothetical protein AAF986_03475 [Pseudomonadota bacterium]